MYIMQDIPLAAFFRILFLYIFHVCSYWALADMRFSIKKSLTLWGIVVAIGAVFTAVSVYRPDIISLEMLYYISIFWFNSAYLYIGKGDFGYKLFISLTYLNIFIVIMLIPAFFSHFLFHDAALVSAYGRIITYVIFLVLYLRFGRATFIRTCQPVQGLFRILCVVPLLYFIMQSRLLILPAFRYGSVEVDYYTAFLMISTLLYIYYYSFHMIILHGKEKERHQIALQNEFLQQELSSYQAREQENRKLRHDFRHHNRTMLEFVHNHDLDGLLHYLHEYESEIDLNPIERYTANTVVNHIVCAYARRARKQDIAMQVDISIPEILHIKDLDMVAILANMIENAIHGCTTSDSTQATIALRMKIKNNKLVIHCSNPCQAGLVLWQGKPFPKRGVGIDSMISTTEKYRGQIEFQVENAIFECLSILNIPSGNQ